MSALFRSSGQSTDPTIIASQLRIQSALQGQPIPIGWGTFRIAPNVIWYGDFNNAAHPPGGKGGAVSSIFGKNQQGSYSASAIFGVCEGPITISGIDAIFQANSTLASPAALGYTTTDGDYSQAPWTYLSAAHPDQALAYRGIAALMQSNIFLGSSPNLPSLNVQVVTNFNLGAMGIDDANPADVLVDFLTNAHYGVPGWPAGILGDFGTVQYPASGGGFTPTGVFFSTFWTYCQANSLFVSPVLTSSQPASSFLQNILKACNADAVFSQGALRIVPYGDFAITANGSTYNPPSAPEYSLGDDDFIASDVDETVKVTRKAVSLQVNDIRIAYYDRNFQYNPFVPMEAKDDGGIAANGLRPSDIQTFDFFCLSESAASCAQLMLNREKVLRTYEFTIDQAYILLDPTDIVEITCVQQGLIDQAVRIKEIQEQADFSLIIQAEDYLGQTSVVPIFGSTPSGTIPNWNADPGSVNTPVIFEPPPALDSGKVWMAVSGVNTALWGGCEVWISTDNVTYQQIGIINAPARMGVTTALLPAYVGTNPDTVDTLSVNLTESAGILSSGTSVDLSDLATLCFVGTETQYELLAYETATPTAANRYNLTTLNRGVYDTAAFQHNPGVFFVRLDTSIFKYAYPTSEIGNTLFVKFPSFNIYGGGQQQLGNVPAFQYTLVGPVPGQTAPANFAVTAITAVAASNLTQPAIECTWTPIENAAVVGVLVEYQTTGGALNTITFDNPASGVGIIPGLQAGTQYVVSATLVTNPPGVPTTFTASLHVTTLTDNHIPQETATSNAASSSVIVGPSNGAVLFTNVVFDALPNQSVTINAQATCTLSPTGAGGSQTATLQLTVAPQGGASQVMAEGANLTLGGDTNVATLSGSFTFNAGASNNWFVDFILSLGDASIEATNFTLSMQVVKQ